MTRIRILGLALVAVFAIGAAAAATASAHRVWRVNGAVLAVGTKKNLKIVENKPFKLIAGKGQFGEEKIECKKVELSEGQIENIEPEAGKKTGRDKGTVKFKECKDLTKANCELKEPIEVKGKTTALVEDTTKAKIYDDFWPEKYEEAKPEDTHLFAEISGTNCITTKVEGDGVAAEISNAKTEEVKHVFKFPCEPTPGGNPIKEIINWKGATVKLELKAFGFIKVEECGEATVELETKEAFSAE